MKTIKDLLERHNLDENAYKKTKLTKKILKDIEADYKKHMLSIEGTIKWIVETLIFNSEKIHSVRYRQKNPERLIAKIIRKSIEDNTRIINLSTYKKEITDLVGIRILHLIKEDWESIDKFIRENYEFGEDPIIYYRKGDDIENYKGKGFKLEEHPKHYRSIHYLIKVNPNKKNHLIAEIQVRTLNEEVWSEIDHTIRYPEKKVHSLIEDQLTILNRVSGSADEIGSFVLKLDESFKNNESTLNAKEKIITDLKSRIQKFDSLSKDDKKDFTESVEKAIVDLYENSEKILLKKFADDFQIPKIWNRSKKEKK